MVSAKPCCTLMQDRSFQLFLLLLALAFALVLPQLVPYTSQESFAEIPVTGGQTAASPRQVRQITYAFPAELEVEQKIYSADELMRGRMLLLNEHHPLPDDVPAPNTTSIAAYGKGRVPVENFQIKSGRQTIEALAELFLDLNSQGVSGLIVADGTVSRAQQRQRQEDSVREGMKVYSIADPLPFLPYLFRRARDPVLPVRSWCPWPEPCCVFSPSSVHGFWWNPAA